MADHPLTDEIIYEIQMKNGAPCYEGYDDMRAAADWQLKQVIQFMKEHEELFGGSGMIFFLKDAMRPQQQES